MWLTLLQIPKAATIINQLANSCCKQIVRNGRYFGSKFLVDAEANTKYEVTKNPDESKYVENILPPVLVPEPKKLPKYRSGWKPPAVDFKDRPYYIARSRNHMMPVYLLILQNGSVRRTVIRNIKGDIWQLEKELKPFFQDLVKPRRLRWQIDEFAGKILINGDHVNALKYWLAQRDY